MSKLRILIAYAGFIVGGVIIMALFSALFESTDPLWKRTINDTVHTLWGIALVYAWLWLFRGHLMRLDNRVAQDCLRRSQEILERATRMHEETQRLFDHKDGHTEIDLEI